MNAREPMKQAVARLLEGKRLSARRLAQLNALVAQADKGDKTGKVAEDAHAKGAAPRGVRIYWGVAAVVSIVAVALAAMQYGAFAPFTADVHQRIADEVATNHLKLKPLEVQSGDMVAVRRFFEPLDFGLIESSRLENTPWRMAGGRFCTIRGEAAAQLRMHDDRGGVQTVYQVPYEPAAHRDVPDVLRGATPLTLYSQGLEVRLWQERGLLFATVR